MIGWWPDHRVGSGQPVRGGSLDRPWSVAGTDTDLDAAVAAAVVDGLAVVDRLARTVTAVLDRSVKGGSVAVGHPFAATGTRILATLAKLLRERGSGRGLISVCTAGGMGVTAILEAA